MNKRFFTPEQTEFFTGLGFRVLKIKAEYCPDVQQGHVRVEKLDGQLQVYAMRGSYGLEQRDHFGS